MSAVLFTLPFPFININTGGHESTSENCLAQRSSYLVRVLLGFQAWRLQVDRRHCIFWALECGAPCSARGVWLRGTQKAIAPRWPRGQQSDDKDQRETRRWNRGGKGSDGSAAQRRRCGVSKATLKGWVHPLSSPPCTSTLLQAPAHTD